MIRKIASIHITFSAIITLGILLMGGVVLSYFPTHQKALDGLNTTHIHHWLMQFISSNSLATIWTVLLCLASGVLFVNALTCSVTTLLPAALRLGSIKQWSFLCMHLLFLLVLTCHGLALISGHKTTEIELYPGESRELFNGFSLVVEGTKFVDDTRLISMKMKQSRPLMTRKTFHADQNSARVILLKNQEQVASQRVMLLKPLVHDDMRITLTRFLLKGNPGKNKNNKSVDTADGKGLAKEEKIGAAFTVTSNHFTSFFFTAYGLLILTIISYILTTRPSQNGRGDNIRHSAGMGSGLRY